LRFDADRARWVRDEHWHTEQHGATLSDGRYELRVPYEDPTELVLEILRHGDAVEVIAPADLRRTVADELARAARRYQVS